MTELIHNFRAYSDAALLRLLGEYIRHHRLEKNISQSELARRAGISRSTLVEFEKGKSANILTFIQLLRILDLLHVLDHFRVEPQFSPLMLAEMQHAKRLRASKAKAPAKKQKSSSW
jgi:transcriptional regulator with XRE-family HTH domain